MNKQEYLATQATMLTLGKMISKLDLEGFLSHISHTEAAAPIIDPTLYRKAMNNLNEIKKLAQSLQPVQTQFQVLFKTMLETKIKEFEASVDGVPSDADERN